VIELVRNRPFAHLLGARLVSQLGAFFTYMLLIVLSYGATHSVALTMGVMFAAAIGRLASGAFSGVAADRGNPRWLMVISDVYSAAVVAALFFLPGTVWFKYGGAFLIAVGQSFYTPSMNKFEVAIVDASALMDANALLQTVNELVKIIGPALAVFVLTLMPPSDRGIGFLINAACYLVSATLIFQLRMGSDVSRPREHAAAERHERQGWFVEWAAGAAPLRNPAVAAVVMQYVVLLLGVSGADVLMTALVGTFGYPTVDVGYLFAALSAGLILAAMTLKGYFTRWALWIQLGLTGIAMGVFYGGITAIPNIVAMLGANFLLGIFNGIFNVTSTTFWQRVVPGEVLGRFFAMVTSAFSAISLLGMAIVGYLGSIIGASDTIRLAGMLIVLGGVVSTIVMRGTQGAPIPAPVTTEHDTSA
jgi:predicted MFS family arabinose efflux permease